MALAAISGGACPSAIPPLPLRRSPHPPPNPTAPHPLIILCARRLWQAWTRNRPTCSCRCWAQPPAPAAARVRSGECWRASTSLRHRRQQRRQRLHHRHRHQRHQQQQHPHRCRRTWVQRQCSSSSSSSSRWPCRRWLQRQQPPPTRRHRLAQQQWPRPRSRQPSRPAQRRSRLVRSARRQPLPPRAPHSPPQGLYPGEPSGRWAPRR